MKRGDRTSLYERARRLVIGLIVAMPLIIWIIPFGLIQAGVSPDVAMPIMVPLALAWFATAMFATFGLRCPRCRTPLLTRWGGKLYAPWPAKSCSKCGENLMRDQAEAGE